MSCARDVCVVLDSEFEFGGSSSSSTQAFIARYNTARALHTDCFETETSDALCAPGCSRGVGVSPMLTRTFFCICAYEIQAVTSVGYAERYVSSTSSAAWNSPACHQAIATRVSGPFRFEEGPASASSDAGHRSAARARTGWATRLVVVLDEEACDVRGAGARRREGEARMLNGKASGVRPAHAKSVLLFSVESKKALKPKSGAQLRQSDMSSGESSSESSEAEASSPVRDRTVSVRCGNAGSSHPASRAARGLAFLRRDLAFTIAVRQTVDCVRPDAGRDMTKPRAQNVRVTAKPPTSMMSSTALALASGVATKSATRRLTKQEVSYGERLETGLRDTKNRLASSQRTQKIRAQTLAKHDDAGAKLPFATDYAQAAALKLPEKLASANESSRRLGLKTRYKAVTSKEKRSVYVEAYCLFDEPQKEKENAKDGHVSAKGKKKRDQEKPVGPPRRLLSVNTFLNSEQRLWAQARYLETDHAVRAVHTSHRTMRPVTTIETAISAVDDDR
jgi:hypothetical protein